MGRPGGREGNCRIGTVARRQWLVELHSCHDRDQEDEGGDEVDGGAERRPPSRVRDELGAVLPRVLETVGGETRDEEPGGPGDAGGGYHHECPCYHALDRDDLG